MFSFLACLPQTLGDLGPHPIPSQGNRQGPSGTPVVLDSSSRWVATTGQERSQGTLSLRREFFCGCKAEVSPWLPRLPQEPPSGLPLVSAHFGVLEPEVISL